MIRNVSFLVALSLGAFIGGVWAIHISLEVGITAFAASLLAGILSIREDL